MSIDAQFKNTLKQLVNSFSIYNIYLNKAIDVDAINNKYHHLNFNDFQSFKFEIANQQSQPEYLFGHFVICDQMLYLDENGNGRLVPKGKGYEKKLLIAIRKNEQGLISINQVKNDQFCTISWKNKKFKNDNTVPSYEWYFLQKQTSQFENKSIIVTSLKNQNYAISSKSGERFVQLEMFNMYNKQNFVFKAKISNRQKRLYCLEQFSGESCMTATYKIVQNQPFYKEISEWTIIKNLLKDEYFFLSMKYFTYLTNQPEPAGLQLEEANFIFGNQSFKIDDYSQRSEENIEDDSLNYIQKPNEQLNKQENRSKIYDNFPWAQQGMKVIDNNQQQSNSISQSTSSVPYQKNNFKVGNLHPVDIFKSNQQKPQEQNQNQSNNNFQKCILLNLGSKRYLKEKNSEFIETSKQEEATVFIFVPINTEYYIQLDNKFILGSYSDTPVTPIKVLEKMNYPQQKFQIKFFYDSNCEIKQNNFSFQIIGGKLYKSELQSNEYNRFIMQIIN
ncbi:hypothetical protein ABPG72_011243 [Tetrahymena utriculariae]